MATNNIISTVCTPNCTIQPATLAMPPAQGESATVLQGHAVFHANRLTSLYFCHPPAGITSQGEGPPPSQAGIGAISIEVDIARPALSLTFASSGEISRGLHAQLLTLGYHAPQPGVSPLTYSIGQNAAIPSSIVDAASTPGAVQQWAHEEGSDDDDDEDEISSFIRWAHEEFFDHLNSTAAQQYARPVRNYAMRLVELGDVGPVANIVICAMVRFSVALENIATGHDSPPKAWNPLRNFLGALLKHELVAAKELVDGDLLPQVRVGGFEKVDDRTGRLFLGRVFRDILKSMGE